jgi:hypothetical protein
MHLNSINIFFPMQKSYQIFLALYYNISNKNSSFDFVFSSAVIEHVGSFENQIQSEPANCC